MKSSISLLFTITYCLSSYCQRYLTDDYLTLDSIKAGVYGTSIDYQSNIQNLLFDFYEPSNDVLQKRPLIIYLHGGGFNSGSRSYQSVQLLCKRMANKGYAVANIDYRLDPNFDLYNSSTDRRAMSDAMQDAKQAIRYFKANATQYKIDTSLIFIGGESAGAATSMMASFVNKQSEMTTYPMASPNDPIGSTANSSFSDKVSGVLCLCGLILDTSSIELATDPPILWTHGTNDNFIPINLSFNIVLRAVNIGLPIEAKSYKGAGHCPWYAGSPSWTEYLDSTVNDITTFLYPKVNSSTNINEIDYSNEISIYPNPLESRLIINLEKLKLSSSEISIKIISSIGQVILKKSFIKHNNEIQLNIEALEKGIFFILIENNSIRAVKKIIKAH